MNSNRYYDKYKRDPEAKQFYNSASWKKAKNLALVRSHYLCERCLKEDNRIVIADVVHHIIEYKEDKSKSLDLDNLECVCHKHHNNEHSEREKEKKNKISSKIKVIKSRANDEMA